MRRRRLPGLEIGSDEYAMSAAGIGGEAQDLVDLVVLRLGPGGLAPSGIEGLALE